MRKWKANFRVRRFFLSRAQIGWAPGTAFYALFWCARAKNGHPIEATPRPNGARIDSPTGRPARSRPLSQSATRPQTLRLYAACLRHMRLYATATNASVLRRLLVWRLPYFLDHTSYYKNTSKKIFLAVKVKIRN